MNLDTEKAIHFRDQFREARAIALRDAEGFQGILYALERFGSFLTGKITWLADYEEDIHEIARDSALAEQIPEVHQCWHLRFKELYRLVREGRNDALHQGAFARHLTASAIQLALVLEDALMCNRNTAGDYMVREPVCASLWQPLSFIRQQMLANSFTCLPVWSSPDWLLISDYHIAQYLRKGDRKDRLARTLKDAVDDGLVLEQGCTCFADSPVGEVLEKSKGKLVLVIERERTERLVGIVTPFDLL